MVVTGGGEEGVCVIREGRWQPVARMVGCVRADTTVSNDGYASFGLSWPLRTTVTRSGFRGHDLPRPDGSRACRRSW